MNGEVASGGFSGAAQGAMMGGMMGAMGGPVGIGAGALIGGGMGLIGGMAGGKGAAKSRKAASDAAWQQLRHQRMAIAMGQNMQKRTKSLMDKMSVAALADYDKALAAQERNIGRQEQLIAQIDPTMIEASQQALKLMRGETASTLAPLKRQRDMQKQKLLSRLREQLGPGAETSTAGMQAINRFDSETDSLFAGAQQQAIQNLGGTFGQFGNYRPNMGNEAVTFGNLAAGKANVYATSAQLNNQAEQALANAWMGAAGSAGAGSVGAMMQGQYQQNQMNQLMQTGAQLGTAYMMYGGGGGGQKPTVGAGNPSGARGQQAMPWNGE